MYKYQVSPVGLAGTKSGRSVVGQLLTSDRGLRHSESCVADISPLAIEIDLQSTRREGVGRLVVTIEP